MQSSITESESPADDDRTFRTTEFVAVSMDGRFVFLETGDFWNAAGIDAKLPGIPREGEKPWPASQWLRKYRSVEQISWAPALPKVVEDQLFVQGNWIKRIGARTLNLYTAPTLPAGNPGDVQPWLDHAQRVYPTDWRYIVQWLAHRVQRPGEKINHALVLIGDPGVGKDSLLVPVIAAVGPSNYNAISPLQVFGEFDDWKQSVILQVSEVHDLGEHSRFSFYERMKDLCAAPPPILRVNRKYCQPYAIPNLVGVILTSNYATSGLYLPPDDRRHYVASSDCGAGELPSEYFEQLHEWYHNGGIANVASYLRQLDLSDFKPKAPPPKTAAFHAIVAAGRADEDNELADLLDEMAQPPAVTLEQLRQAAMGLGMAGLYAFLDDRKSRKAVGHKLHRAGYPSVHNPGAKDGLWRVKGRRCSIYAQRSLVEREQLAAARDLTRE